MTCDSCVHKITEGLSRSGYKNISVTLHPPQGGVSSDREIKIEEIQKIVTSVGNYQVTELNSQAQPTFVSSEVETSKDSLMPVFVIAGYLVGGVLLRAYLSENFSLHTLMINFMGGFFIVFSMFKFFNLNGFAEAYATYDVVAMKSKFYARAYPFIELALGVSYFIFADLFYVNLITLVLMAIGTIGVVNSLRAKRNFQCACLGTALKLPMTKVTLIEDLLMGLMAFIMIFS